MDRALKRYKADNPWAQADSTRTNETMEWRDLKKLGNYIGAITDDRFHRSWGWHTAADSRNTILPWRPYPVLIFCAVSAAFDPICQYNRISGIAMALSPTAEGCTVSNAIG